MGRRWGTDDISWKSALAKIFSTNRPALNPFAGFLHHIHKINDAAIFSII
jgi:hypothetical protein